MARAKSGDGGGLSGASRHSVADARPLSGGTQRLKPQVQARGQASIADIPFESRAALPVGDQDQELRERIHLIIMAAIGESQNVGLEVTQPGRPGGQQNLARLDPGGLAVHADLLVFPGRESNRVHYPFVAQILNELDARAFIFDDHRVRFVALLCAHDPGFQPGVIQPDTGDLDEVIELAFLQPGGNTK